jgi:hypothetical protein
MIFNNVPTSQIQQDGGLIDIRRQVAGILLEHAGNGAGGGQQLTHRSLAKMLNTGWDKVYISLKSLNDEGAIKIDRNRIIVKPALLQKVAASAGKPE